MFCPNCTSKLEAVDTEKLLSQDLGGGDYYTHQCPNCKTYWHTHLNSDEVVLIATTQDTFARKVKEDLIAELSVRVTELSNPTSTWVGSGMVCSDCGAIDTESNPVNFEPDPYASEINGDDTEGWMCEDCRSESWDNI